MSRIRSIKPEFWSSEQVMECSPTTRLLFIGLWNFCDDAGRHPRAPKQIKALVFPGDDFTADAVSRMLDELSSNGLIVCYTIGDKDYFQITGWQHQKIDRPQPAKYPGIPDDHSSNVRDGGEGMGEERKGSSETIVSGADAPSVIPIDARTALFRDGLASLRAMTGKPDGGCRSLLGKWLKANGDDAKSLLATITRAADVQPADPVAWIEGALRAPDPDDAIYRNVH